MRLGDLRRPQETRLLPPERVSAFGRAWGEGLEGGEGYCSVCVVAVVLRVGVYCVSLFVCCVSVFLFV